MAPKSAKKIRARAPLAGTLDTLPSDRDVRVETVAGLKNGEPALFVTSGSGRVSLLCVGRGHEQAERRARVLAAPTWGLPAA